VILKHAAQTLLVGERLDAAFEKAGLPEGVFQNVVLTHASTETLLGSGAIDHINFTGSVAGGRAIEKALPAPSPRSRWNLAARIRPMCAPTPTSTSPSATSSTAPSSTPASAAAASSASMCMRSLTTRFVEGLVDLRIQYKLGNPLDEATTLGPMAQARFAAWVREQTDEALRKGAKALVDPSPSRPPMRRARLSRAAGPRRRQPPDVGDARGELRPVVGIMKVGRRGSACSS
jgi:hypothetical protein